MTVMTKPAGFRETFDAFHAGSTAPGWVKTLREDGIARFESTGLPTLRDEHWRFTDVAPIGETPFGLANGTSPAADAADLAPLLFEGLGGPRLVFVDGRFRGDLSSLDEMPAGVVVAPLAESITAHEALVKPHLGHVVDDKAEAFTALNTAFLQDGVFVHVPADTKVEGAVEVLWLSTAPNEPRMTHPRTLVVVEAGSEVSIVESYASLGDGMAFTNPVVEVVVRENARVHHTMVERENGKTYMIRTLYADQSRDTFFASHSALFGGALIRNNVYPTLNGEGCDSLLNGLYVPAGTQLQDNRMRVRHAEPHCESRQYYKGILNDRARAMFSGRIIVDEDAQKTDAVQTNMNMLLSDDAMVETKPQLEIYADDVKCTHGATVGQIDDEAVFYFQARGIPEETARRLLVFAFANEVLERIGLEPVRDRLRGLLADRLG